MASLQQIIKLQTVLRLKQPWYSLVTSDTRGLSQVNPTTTEKAPKTFSSIPGAKELPLIGTMLDFLKIEKYSLHKFFLKRSEQYGVIYKENAGQLKSVLLQDPDHIQEMMKHEGKYPSRTDIAAWKLYRNDRNLSHGTLMSEGEEWQRHRSSLNAHMMRPHNVALHTDDFNAVVTDFMDLLPSLIKQGQGQVPDLQKKLFRWALESSCMVIFDERLGCLLPNPPPEILDVIKSVAGIMETTERLLVLPPPVAKALRLPVWTEHCKHWDLVLNVGEGLVKKKLSKDRADLAAGKQVSGLIATLVEQGELTEHEISMNCVDLMGGAVETTSNTILWILHLLSKHPDKQQILCEEVRKVAPSGQVIGQKELREMPYLKAVLKETLRLYPVAAFMSRIMKADVVIGGYQIPKDTLIIAQLWNMGRDPKIYKDPESFRPERWLRENALEEHIHPFANLNFGHGARACIGRRVAELEMFLLVTRLLQKYELRDGNPGREVDTESTLVLQPKGSLDLVFKDRI